MKIDEKGRRIVTEEDEIEVRITEVVVGCVSCEKRFTREELEEGDITQLIYWCSECGAIYCRECKPE